MNGSMIPHHRQQAYDRWHADGWWAGYRAGRRVTQRATAILCLSLGMVAGIAFQVASRWLP